MSAPCRIVGDADMYGLGIRTGFYLQWYARIASDWLTPSEVANMRISNNLFLAATFLAILIKTIRNPSELRATEVYVVLLFAFGSIAMLLPAVMLRALTWNKPQWDPWRKQKVPSSNMHKFLFNVLLLAVSTFGLWFYVTGIHVNPELNCREYGFLFYKVGLRASWFRALNIALNGYSLVVVLFSICVWILWKFYGFGGDDQFEIDKDRKRWLETIFTISSCIVSTTMVIAVELTIHWNGIRGVQRIDSAGQTIPLVLGIGALTRVVYKFFHPSSHDNFTMDPYDFGQAVQSGRPPDRFTFSGPVYEYEPPSRSAT